MHKKYELIPAPAHPGFFQIRALKYFVIDKTTSVKAGDLGGYIQKEANLSQEGKAWVSENARVRDDARVIEDAQIMRDAIISGNAVVSGQAGVLGGRVTDNAHVSGEAIIAFGIVSGHAIVCGQALLWGRCEVTDYAVVHGKAEIRDDGRVCDYATVYDGVVYGYGTVEGSARVLRNGSVSGRARVRGTVQLVTDVTEGVHGEETQAANGLREQNDRSKRRQDHDYRS